MKLIPVKHVPDTSGWKGLKAVSPISRKVDRTVPGTQRMVKHPRMRLSEEWDIHSLAVQGPVSRSCFESKGWLVCLWIAPRRLPQDFSGCYREAIGRQGSQPLARFMHSQSLVAWLGCRSQIDRGGGAVHSAGFRYHHCRIFVLQHRHPTLPGTSPPYEGKQKPRNFISFRGRFEVYFEA